MEILDKAIVGYDADISRLKADVLAAVFGSHGKSAIVEPDVAQMPCRCGHEAYGEEAVTKGDIDLAGQFVRIATMAAYRSKEAELERETGKRRREIDRSQARFSLVQKALETLRTDPADAEANLKAGQWFCFVKGQWDQGLPMLAKGSNKPWPKRPNRILVCPGPKQQAALADAWWNLAEKDSAADKAAMQGRARHWYEETVDKSTGLKRPEFGNDWKLSRRSLPPPGKPASRGLVADVTDLPFVGKSIVERWMTRLLVDRLDFWEGYKLPPTIDPSAKVKHFFFLHATAEFHINLEAKVKAGQAAKRFKAYLGMPPKCSAECDADGNHLDRESPLQIRHASCSATSPNQDFNPVDLVLPPRTTEIVVRSFLGPAKKETYAWGVMINPVITFRQ